MRGPVPWQAISGVVDTSRHWYVRVDSPKHCGRYWLALLGTVSSHFACVRTCAYVCVCMRMGQYGPAHDVLGPIEIIRRVVVIAVLRLHVYALEKKSGTDYSMYADSDLIEITPLRVIAEVPILPKDFQTDRMSSVSHNNDLALSPTFVW